jgi:hypothetical protein
MVGMKRMLRMIAERNVADFGEGGELLSTVSAENGSLTRMKDYSNTAERKSIYIPSC